MASFPRLLHLSFKTLHPQLSTQFAFLRSYQILDRATSRASNLVVSPFLFLCFPYCSLYVGYNISWKRRWGVSFLVLSEIFRMILLCPPSLFIPGWESLILVQQKKLESRDRRWRVQGSMTGWRKRKGNLFRILTFDPLFLTRLPCCQSWHCFTLLD